MTSEDGSRRARSNADRQAAADLRLLDREFAARRLQIFRTCLARRVCLASPLLLDACKGRKLDEALWGMRPAIDWPDRPEVDLVIRSRSRRRGHPTTQVDTSLGPSGSKAGDLVMDHLALRIADRSVHMIMRFGGMAVHTTDLGGRVLTPPLDSWVDKRELVGFSLERILKHPVAEGRDYWILSVEPTLSGRVTIVEFKAAPIEWRVPWARPWDPIF
ncbi:MAG: hypothetical protein AB1431_01220 [Pseudomonadota bacterium]|jgi:hypothetical protein|nr:hypothetical protein [Sphingobium naphthae]MEC7931876.1 hypothetical protein [Pseudomonadota bacterium]|tara:strand:- start:446 stop:1096 length:651 start_codon:yes stop_codon:yes gene_type:complete